MIKKFIIRLQGMPKDFFLFWMAVCFFGFSQSIVDSTFNNFLSDTFSISNLQRSILEIPRELPGLLVVFIFALLFFLCSRRLAAFAHLLSGLGILLIALFSFNFPVMLVWLFIFSVGQHLFLPLLSSIGMELAKEGQAGKRLGQLGGANSFTAVLGSLFITICFHYFHLSFKKAFLIASAGYFIGSFFIFHMRKREPESIKNRLIFRREYVLYYWLCILFGTRKQIFLTFAPWVLVTVFHQKTQVIAFLLALGGTLNIIFRPVLGSLIDRYGERLILAMEALSLIVICLGYGFGRSVFSEQTAFYIACVCYITDQLLMAAGMARATYLKKIALAPADIHNTLSMGTSLDHIFSILIAVFGGLIWTKFGYQFVFLIGALIASVNFFSVMRVKTSGPTSSKELLPDPIPSPPAELD